MFSDTYQAQNFNWVMPYYFGLISVETFAMLFGVLLDISIVYYRDS